MNTTDTALKALLLQINMLQTQVTALRFALEDHGILTPSVKSSVMSRAREIWGPRREAIEKIGATEELTLEDLLSSFEGPKQ